MKQEDLNEKTVAELRTMCFTYGINGMSRARKDDIIAALEEYFEDCDSPDACDKDTDSTQNAGSDSGIVSMNAQLSSYVNLKSKSDNDKYITNITVSCGAASGNFPVVGKTVGAVSEFLREVLNIDRLSVGVINGEQVTDDYVLSTGDSLEFLKAGGRKG